MRRIVAAFHLSRLSASLGRVEAALPSVSGCNCDYRFESSVGESALAFPLCNWATLANLFLSPQRGIDPNNRYQLVAWAIVEGENGESWCYLFRELLTKELITDTHDIFITSRSQATEEIPTKAACFLCLHSIKRSFKDECAKPEDYLCVWQHRHTGGLSHNLRIYYKRLTKSRLNICRGWAER